MVYTTPFGEYDFPALLRVVGCSPSRRRTDFSSGFWAREYGSIPAPERTRFSNASGATMFQFKWQTPAPDSQNITLEVHSRSGWFGRKVLRVGDHTLYRRGRFAGIEQRFSIPDSGRPLHLRFVLIPGTPIWRPALMLGDTELPEQSGTEPPQLMQRPAGFSAVVGVTYLFMLMGAVMVPSIIKILDALYLRLDDRKFVYTVIDPDEDIDALRIVEPHLPAAIEGHSYSTTFEASGGQPPYVWEPVKKGWPKGWRLDSGAGEVSFIVDRPHDYTASVRVTDSNGAKATRAIAVIVDSPSAGGPDWPEVANTILPPATLGRDYSIQLRVVGGEPPYEWKTIGKRIPKEIKLDKRTGMLTSTPTTAGTFPIMIRVVDHHYRASQDILPWVMPFVATGICLLGYWNMRKWGVYLYASAIALQLILWLSVGLPITATAVALQGVLCFIGLVHLGRMR